MCLALTMSKTIKKKEYTASDPVSAAASTLPDMMYQAMAVPFLVFL